MRILTIIFLTDSSLGLNKLVITSNYVKVKNTLIETDSGILMEDVSAETLLQSELSNVDILMESQTVLTNLVIKGTRLQDVYSRRYIKVQA
jgi:hypothetical protein